MRMRGSKGILRVSRDGTGAKTNQLMFYFNHSPRLTKIPFKDTQDYSKDPFN